ncbi:ung, partial [Symbiodinium microadriaticum]
NLGWERFTDAAIRTIDRELSGVIFLLWGKDAQSKAKLVDSSRHTVLIAGHPSPLSYEKHFKGCDHFRKVNAPLVTVRRDVIQLVDNLLESMIIAGTRWNTKHTGNNFVATLC